MLKPDKNDPNYDEQMKRYHKDPASWGPSGAMPIQPDAKSDDKKSDEKKK
jgi:hypothetical protein